MTASVQSDRFSAIDSLLDLAASATHTPREHVARLGAALLATLRTDAGPRGGRSGLNYDQSPLQVCFSIGSEGVHCRLLADPALELADTPMRFAASYAAMTEAVTLTSSTSMRALCDRTLELNLPEDGLAPDDYPDGVLWVAAGVDTPGVAMYVDARRGGDEVAWPRLRNWFASLLPDMSAADAALNALRGDSHLMCLGVEGVAPSNARAKLYWRLASPKPIGAIGIDRFDDSRFHRFLAVVMRDRDIRLTGVVPSIGFRLENGMLSDVKLDVCACRKCLDWSPSEWESILVELNAEFGFPRVPVAEWISHGEMAFIGFGLDHRDTPRLNLYLKCAPGSI